MDLLSRLMKDEGFSPTAYRCPGGKWTIGYGRNVDREGGKGVTNTEAISMLNNDINECEYDLRELFGPTFWDTIDLVRRNALLNMRFQMGAGGFRRFSNMIEAVKRREWMVAAWHALDSRWSVQTPGRAQRVAQELRDGVDLE